MNLEIDNWHWAGVPFYIRTGKHRVADRGARAVVVQHGIERSVDVDGSLCNHGAMPNDVPDGVEKLQGVTVKRRTRCSHG